jgi:NitT/TauT family transport system permease protein
MTAVATGRAPDPQRIRRPSIVVAKGLVGAVVLVLLFEGARLIGLLPTSAVPGSIDIARAVVAGFADGTLLSAVGSTMLAWLGGIIIALVIGVPVGLGMGLSRWVDSGLERIVEFFRPIPVIALVPIAIVVFGIELSMQVFLVAITCAFPILIGTRSGVRAVDPLQAETAAAFGLSHARVIARVVLPSSIPSIATALRIAASVGVVVAVAAELISGSPGLGQLLVSQQRAGNIEAAWACIIVTGVIGLLINSVLAIVERAVAGWQEQSTEGRR